MEGGAASDRTPVLELQVTKNAIPDMDLERMAQKWTSCRANSRLGPVQRLR